MPTKLFDGTRLMGEVNHRGYVLSVHHCGSCGLVFAIDDEVETQRRRDHQSFYCPNCRSAFHFGGESDIEEAQRQRDEAQRRAKASRDLLEHEQRSHAATRGHLTRTKRRIKHGVCPCCNRSFEDLERHMSTKHPDYAA